ncbi:hypothetical protein [Cecembia rubra]|uniref:Uncharacterized protein n=1 Tax=Cecembia rubra TaxID=1485585 RepID=A0A2P8E2V9_9BACT|nr:hypothetical protein [Cecembia rubra]PSL03812.1 hypothetical protein CLV48_10651 [Cecembia rubra]
MFEGPNYPKPLDESLFDEWLENGRSRKIPYAYLLVIWDELDGMYLPFFAEDRSEIQSYPRYGSSPENQLLVAAYDLYSGTRVI